VIRRRRSTRSFTTDPIPRSALDAVLAAAAAPIAGDAFRPSIVEPFLIVNAVEGLEPGLYGPGPRLIRQGTFRRASGGLALGQDLAADAAVNVYLLSDLVEVGERLGERGYRVAQIAGGIAGARIELAAIGLGLGGTGLTFFDDEVIRFFGSAAEGREVMYLAAVGVRARR
jgi:nitroreductase